MQEELATTSEGGEAQVGQVVLIMATHSVVYIHLAMNRHDMIAESQGVR